MALTLTGMITVDCRAIFYGGPALIHPDTGVVFGFAGGTHTYALRLPEPERIEAIKAGAPRISTEAETRGFGETRLDVPHVDARNRYGDGVSWEAPLHFAVASGNRDADEWQSPKRNHAGPNLRPQLPVEREKRGLYLDGEGAGDWICRNSILHRREAGCH